jgi:plastocyanin
MTIVRSGAVSIVVGLLIAVTACSGGTPAAPSTPVPPVTVAVTATGFKPVDVVVAVGARVTFTNNDDRLHSIASLPLTTHADCPPINDVGVLVPGQSKATGALTEARICGYHDTFSEGGTLLTGTITVR